MLKATVYKLLITLAAVACLICSGCAVAGSIPAASAAGETGSTLSGGSLLSSPTQPTSSSSSLLQLSSSSPFPADPNHDQILRLALAASERAGDSAPSSVEWVYSDWAKIAALLGQSTVSPTSSQSCVLVIITGNFTATYAHPPKGHSTLTGSVITLVLDATTLNSLQYGLGTASINLSPLGPIFNH